MKGSNMGITVAMVMTLIIYFADLSVAENNDNGLIDYIICYKRCLKTCPDIRIRCYKPCAKQCRGRTSNKVDDLDGLISGDHKFVVSVKPN
ncbi:hypothetical protein CASFOL_038650 [Castilleja foliolosa]|uniref:Uncharacterized protein n=1 Tax=Castilleja foliolosa TaxID=1961234 RepID=A0ABD3BM40_9LAMI